MPIRSMTGYAQLKQQHGHTAFTLSVKSVNHRFLDLHLRLPGNSDALEQRLRKLFKERMHRGHVELTVSVSYADAVGVSINRELVTGYVKAFRALATELNLPAEPDLNSIFRLNGALSGSSELPDEEGLQDAIVSAAEQVLARLDESRVQEGEHLSQELQKRLDAMERNTNEIESLRGKVLDAHLVRIRARMQELLEGKADPDRLLQEAALLSERSDIQEEIVRMKTHIQHFRGLLEEGTDIGKKLDFLSQEMNREANTMLSKTTGVAGEALRITELGLALKSDIEKSREQVQNIE